MHSKGIDLSKAILRPRRMMKNVANMNGPQIKTTSCDILRKCKVHVVHVVSTPSNRTGIDVNIQLTSLVQAKGGKRSENQGVRS